jgi:hypothetical protein
MLKPRGAGRRPHVMNVARLTTIAGRESIVEEKND